MLSELTLKTLWHIIMENVAAQNHISIPSRTNWKMKNLPNISLVNSETEGNCSNDLDINMFKIQTIKEDVIR